MESSGWPPTRRELVGTLRRSRSSTGPTSTSSRRAAIAESAIPFTGTADEIAVDIHKYEEMGVGYLVVDLARLSRNLDEMLQHMEELATQVWPRV